MPRRFDPQQAAFLDSPERLTRLKPYSMLKAAGVREGSIAIDLGCGTGLFSFPLLDLVGEKGAVYAIDGSEAMLARLRAKNPPPNLRVILANAAQTDLEAAIADFCLLAFVLHEVEHPGEVLSEAHRLLKPGGRALVVDWQAVEPPPGPPLKERLPRKMVEESLGQSGFSNIITLLDEVDHYLIAGAKPDDELRRKIPLAAEEDPEGRSRCSDR